MTQRRIVFDLETQRTFDEVEGREPARLGISVIGAYFYDRDEYRCYEESEIPQFEQALSQADRIIGFNTRRFDLPVLQPYLKYIKSAQLPIFDLMDELEKIPGHRVSLQSLATATLNEGKSGSGLDAIRYYRDGDMNSLKKYCLDDVRLTKELYEHGKRLGILSYLSKDKSSRLSVKVDWRDEELPQNLSLF